MTPTNTPLARRHRTVPERAPRAFLVGDTKRRLVAWGSLMSTDDGGQNRDRDVSSGPEAIGPLARDGAERGGAAADV